MRVLLRHAAISVLAGVISVFCLINALLQRDMAQGDKELSVANLVAADSYYSSALARLSSFGRIPWIFSEFLQILSNFLSKVAGRVSAAA